MKKINKTKKELEREMENKKSMVEYRVKYMTRADYLEPFKKDKESLERIYNQLKGELDGYYFIGLISSDEYFSAQDEILKNYVDYIVKL